MNSIQLIRRATVLMLLSAPLLGGCASRGFVRNYVDVQMAGQKEIHDRFQNDLSAVKATADSAEAHSQEARLLAHQAVEDAAAARRLAARIASGDLRYNVVQTQDVYFGFDETALNPKASAMLDQIASKLKENSRYVLEVMGNTDEVGSERYNYRLGQERAEMVRRYMNTIHGIPLSRLATMSLGKSKPAGKGESEKFRALNRRAEIRLLEVQDADLVSMSGSPESPKQP